MRITENFKNQVRKAIKQHGVNYVQSVCSQCFTTVYSHYIHVDDVLSAPIGSDMSYGRYNGNLCPPEGGKAMKYMDIMAL